MPTKARRVSHPKICRGDSMWPPCVILRKRPAGLYFNRTNWSIEKLQKPRGRACAAVPTYPQHRKLSAPRRNRGNRLSWPMLFRKSKRSIQRLPVLPLHMHMPTFFPRTSRGEYKSASHLRSAKEKSLKRGRERERWESCHIYARAIRGGGGGTRVNYRLGARWYGGGVILLLLFCCFSTHRKEMSEQTRASRHPEPANFYSYFMAINFFAVTPRTPPLTSFLFLSSHLFSSLYPSRLTLLLVLLFILFLFFTLLTSPLPISCTFPSSFLIFGELFRFDYSHLLHQISKFEWYFFPK